MQLSPEAIITLLITLVVVFATLVFQRRALLGQAAARRPLRALDTLRAALGRGAETGKAIHISPGTGTIGSGIGTRATTAETIAGLLVAGRVSSEAALNGAPILVSSGDAVSHLALRGIVRQSYQQAGQLQDYDPARIQLLAHQNELAYATGVSALYGRQQLEASILVGSFNQEFLLIGEESAQRAVPQVAGTTSTVGLPLMMLTSDATLIGEEIFAAEAYLTTTAPAQARLQTADLLRTTTILLIVGGVIYSLLQPQLGLPPLPR
jgi:hypothetical protein